jgi:hypothetical protein
MAGRVKKISMTRIVGSEKDLKKYPVCHVVSQHLQKNVPCFSILSNKG